MSNDIYTVDLLRSLPEVLKNDENLRALAHAIANQLQTVAGMTKENILYSRIDELPEDVLDAIAYDFNVFWYNYNAGLAVKRKALKDARKIHRKVGTKWAIERLAEIYFAKSMVIEWFVYGGEPYHFIVYTSDEDVSEAEQEAFIAMLNKMKNARSVLDQVVIGILGSWQYYGYRGKTWSVLSTYTWNEAAAGISGME